MHFLQPEKSPLPLLHSHPTFIRFPSRPADVPYKSFYKVACAAVAAAAASLNRTPNSSGSYSVRKQPLASTPALRPQDRGQSRHFDEAALYCPGRMAV